MNLTRAELWIACVFTVGLMGLALAHGPGKETLRASGNNWPPVIKEKPAAGVISYRRIKP